MDVALTAAPGVEPLERETIRRVAWRLLPLLMLGFFCNYLDRANIGMAALTMNRQLGFSNAVFGFGAGLFFLGYLIAEIPSNLILNRVGARRWMARILITWGILSGCTAFVSDQWSFFGIRALLGLAEAGFFPGVVLYLTWWFPAYYRSRMMAVFYSAQVVSNIIGPPIGGLLLQLDGLGGLHGWQWLFVVEALPAIIMSFLFWRLLTDRPRDAAWLAPGQRAWLAERMASEQAEREAIRKYTLAEAFSNVKVWLLTIAWFGHCMANTALAIFMPLIIRGLGVSTGMVGLVSAVPYIFALAALFVWARHSDLTGERLWHVAGAWLLCSAGLSACIFIGVGHPVVTMIALIFALMGLMSVSPVFWAVPSALLSGTAAAGGLAMINSIGNLGGWFGPSIFGLIKDATGSDNIALLCLALAPVVSIIAVLMVGHDRRLERIPPRA